MRNDELQQILKICRKHALPKNGKTLLCWHQGGYIALLNIEIAIAFMMEQHGYIVKMVVCDGVLEACTVRGDEDIPVENWKQRCSHCIAHTVHTLEQFGIEYVLLSVLLAGTDLEAVKNSVNGSMSQIHDMPNDIAELDVALTDSLLRFYGGRTEEVYDPEIVKKFAYSMLCNYYAAQTAVQLYKPDNALVVHCAYSDHKPPYDVFTALNIPVTTYSGSFLPDSILINTINAHRQPSKRRIIDRQWQEICQAPSTDKEKILFNSFYKDRYINQCHIDSVTKPLLTKKDFCDTFKLDPSKKTFLFPLHMNWDISNDISKGFFFTYNELVLTTIQEMCAIDNAQWLIKLHPTEERVKIASSIGNLIRERFPTLPQHVKIVAGDVPVSPLSFYNFCDGMVGTQATAVIEMAALGKTCLMASKGFYYQRGFTLDPEDKCDYLQLLHKMPEVAKLNAAQQKLAQRYLITYVYRMSMFLPNYKHSKCSFISNSGFCEYIPGKNPIISNIMQSIKECKIALRPWDKL